MEWIATILQGIFLAQGSNLGFLLCRQMLYYLSHQGRSYILCYIYIYIYIYTYILYTTYIYIYMYLNTMCAESLSHVWLFVTPWTAALQGCHVPVQGNLPNSGIEPRSPTLQVDSLLSEPPGKPKNTGVGSLSLLQENFLTQESNWGLPHCGWILFQLTSQEPPQHYIYIVYK